MINKNILKNNLVYNSLELPAYWWHTWKSKDKITTDWSVRRIDYGRHSRQYALEITNKDAGERNGKTAIYFHGGAWTFGTPEQFLPAARLFLEAGYRVVMPSYRRLPWYDFAAIYADLLLMRTALLRDAEVEVVAGMSAGGHLAASISWRPEYWADAGLEPPGKVILCGAVLDLDEMGFGPGLRLLGGAPGSDAYREANPAAILERSARLPARHLVIHGKADGTANFKQVLCSCESLKNRTELTTHWLDGGTHLDSCRWMYTDDAAAREIRKFLQAQ